MSLKKLSRVEYMYFIAGFCIKIGLTIIKTSLNGNIVQKRASETIEMSNVERVVKKSTIIGQCQKEKLKG